jgi:glycosyltransferase involved in cell wall biosynthesis
VTRSGDDDPLHILQVTEASGAGTLRVVEVLRDGLTERGHLVTVAYARRPETPSTFMQGHAGAHALAWDRRRLRTQLRTARLLRRLVSEIEPDIVHLHSTMAGLVGGLARRGSPPHVYTSHGWASSSPRRWPLPGLVASGDRWIIRRVDVVGAVSGSDADLGERLGARRVAVVPNGIPEIGLPGSPPARSGTAVVVSGGRLVPERRPVEAAHILREVHDVAQVRWIGGGDPAAEARLVALGVEVTGWLPRTEAVDEIAGASAYLHWSACDGQSIAVLEAMARDVVVIASDIPANRELLSPFQLCRSPLDAAAKLRRVVEDPDLREELLDAQRGLRQQHGASRMVQGWLDVYRSTIASAARDSA